MMQNAPPPKYLRLHQTISRDKQAVAAVKVSHDVVSVNVSVNVVP